MNPGPQIQINKVFEQKIKKMLLFISFTICLGAQKNRLIEAVLWINVSTTYVLVEK